MTGNFGPGHANAEVSQDAVTAAPECDVAEDDSDEESIPLSQLQYKKILEDQKQLAGM